MVRPDLAQIGAEFEIAILGVRHKATIIAESPFDPDNNALKS
jgi:dimethylglycine dehydrogenase